MKLLPKVQAEEEPVRRIGSPLLKSDYYPCRARDVPLQGDEFLKTVYPCLDFVFNIAFRLSGNRYDAEDLTHETFTIAYQKLHQLREPRKCRYWLLMIARNLYLRSCAKKCPGLLEVSEIEDYLAVLENMVAEDDPEKLLIKKTTTLEIQKLLQGLPEKYKTPLVLFYTEEWSCQEIAEALKVPMGAVMSRIGRGRELMKKKILEGGRRQRGANVIPLCAGFPQKG